MKRLLLWILIPANLLLSQPAFIEGKPLPLPVQKSSISRKVGLFLSSAVLGLAPSSASNFLIKDLKAKTNPEDCDIIATGWTAGALTFWAYIGSLINECTQDMTTKETVLRLLLIAPFAAYDAHTLGELVTPKKQPNIR